MSRHRRRRHQEELLGPVSISVAFIIHIIIIIIIIVGEFVLRIL